VVALGFLLASRPRIPRRLLAATLAVVLVCWSFPLVQEATHRPGNVEDIVEAATLGEPTLGPATGWYSVVHAVGVPPWWLQGPRDPFARLAEVAYAPPAASTATAALVLAALAGVAIAGFRSRRRELAAAALIALGLMIALALVAASTPKSVFGVVGYTLWWGSPAGMFSWLVLGWSAVAFGGAAAVRATRLRVPARIATGVALLGVVAAGVIVAARGKPDRLEPVFQPARTIAARVRDQTPPGGTILLTGPRTPMGFDLQGVIAYALRGGGTPFVTSNLPGIGTRYAASRHAHERVMLVVERPRPGRPAGPVIARVAMGGPTDAPPPERARRTVIVTLAP
jgi:hypothetical protein